MNSAPGSFCRTRRFTPAPSALPGAAGPWNFPARPNPGSPVLPAPVNFSSSFSSSSLVPRSRPRIRQARRGRKPATNPGRAELLLRRRRGTAALPNPSRANPGRAELPLRHAPRYKKHFPVLPLFITHFFMPGPSFPIPGRCTPAKGVHVCLGGPNWVFLTVCTDNRERWLAQASVQQALHDIWKNTATAWLVSDYLLMPDHLHLFCAPQDLNFTIERWMGFW